MLRLCDVHTALVMLKVTWLVEVRWELPGDRPGDFRVMHGRDGSLLCSLAFCPGMSRPGRTWAEKIVKLHNLRVKDIKTDKTTLTGGHIVDKCIYFMFFHYNLMSDTVSACCHVTHYTFNVKMTQQLTSTIFACLPPLWPFIPPSFPSSLSCITQPVALGDDITPSPCASISNPNPDFPNGAQPQPSKTLIQSGALHCCWSTRDLCPKGTHTNTHA